MTAGLGLLGIAGTTPLAEVCQRALSRLDGHPQIEVRALIADDPADVGARLGDVVTDRWIPEDPPPQRWLDATLVGIEAAPLRDAGVDLVLSSLIGPRARELDPQVAAHGFPVVSESMGLRLEPDVPLVVPEVNADHLGIIKAQQARRGWDTGFVVASPLCTAVITAVVCKPLQDAFGIDAVVATSLQALSGAGPTGVPAMRSLDNVIPYIGGEEEKLRAELAKILGARDGDTITDLHAPVSATCTRVGVRHGHTIALSLSLGQPASADLVASALAEFRGRPTELGLALSPTAPIRVLDGADRPQPLLDRDAGEGRVVSVGRVRPHAALPNGIGMVVVGHNHERGTWGNAILLCELLVGEGLAG